MNGRVLDFNVPIVGQPCTVYTGDVCAVAVCNCDPTNKPFLLSSTHSIVACAKCRSVFRIVACQFDAANGPVPQVGIAMVGRLDEPEQASEEPGDNTPPPPADPTVN